MKIGHTSICNGIVKCYFEMVVKLKKIWKINLYHCFDLKEKALDI